MALQPQPPPVSFPQSLSNMKAPSRSASPTTAVGINDSLNDMSTALAEGTETSSAVVVTNSDPSATQRTTMESPLRFARRRLASNCSICTTPCGQAMGVAPTGPGGEYIGIFDIFKIGIGPSSSHTVGPMWAGKKFAEKVAASWTERIPQPPQQGAESDNTRKSLSGATVRVDLFGSLALTGKGHATDRATVLGLSGLCPDTIVPDDADRIFEDILQSKVLCIDGGPLQVDFEFKRDLVFHMETELPLHPNGMTLTARCEDISTGERVELEETYYSIGGGFIKTEAELLGGGVRGDLKAEKDSDGGLQIKSDDVNEVKLIAGEESCRAERGGDDGIRTRVDRELLSRKSDLSNGSVDDCSSSASTSYSSTRKAGYGDSEASLGESPPSLVEDSPFSNSPSQATSDQPDSSAKPDIFPIPNSSDQARLLQGATNRSTEGNTATDEVSLKANGLSSLIGKTDKAKGRKQPVPYHFNFAEELINICLEKKMTFAQVMFANECAHLGWSQQAVYEKIDKIAETIDACVERGLRVEGRMPVSNIPRRAPRLARRLRAMEGKGVLDPLVVTDWIALYARAVNEENACGGRIVTTPTNGAAGTLPAVLTYYRRFVPNSTQQGVREFLATAAAVGSLCKRNASISGAEAGCQAEVGSACAMAAAGLAAVSGAGVEQIENAAEIGLEHFLGMTCDPVMGLVQIPCIERNCVASVKAVTACRLAVAHDGEHEVSLDSCIETMYKTGLDMQAKYRETSVGGLALFAKKRNFAAPLDF